MRRRYGLYQSIFAAGYCLGYFQLSRNCENYSLKSSIELDWSVVNWLIG